MSRPPAPEGLVGDTPTPPVGGFAPLHSRSLDSLMGMP